MDEDEGLFLMCLSVAGNYKPPSLSYQDHCVDCGRSVWRSYSSPPEGKALCFPCGDRRLKTDENAEFKPPTEKQLEDARRYLKRFLN